MLLNNEEPSATSSPERGLLVAMLDRSLKDLELGDRKNIKDSIAWFRGLYVEGISFYQCIEELELTSKHVKIIMERVDLAEAWLRDRSVIRTHQKEYHIKGFPRRRI